MVQWLVADLAANPSRCTLAYFHHPLFSSGKHGGLARMRPVWRALFRANADVIINGHEHIYERFAPQNPDGVRNLTRGIRQFTVGTGGASHTNIHTIHPNSEIRNTTAFGVLKLTLEPDTYTWEFIATPGSSFHDTGTGACH
jgi:hypothetical protein